MNYAEAIFIYLRTLFSAIKRGVSMKRAQGLPISTIIIAALGIMVLVVMAAIFSGQIGKFGRAASECPGRCYKASPPAENAGLFQTNDCNEFETELSGSYIPRGMPSNVQDPSGYRCDSCCIVSG